MRKILCMLAALILCISMIGCSMNHEAYEKAIDEGFEYLEESDYEKAKTAFEQALEEKSDDDQASQWLEQTTFIIQAEQQLENGQLDDAEGSSERVLETAEQSNSLVTRAKGIKDEIDQLKERRKEFVSIYEEANDLLDQQVYNSSIKMLTKVLEDDMDHLYYQDIKNDMEMLLEEITKAKKAKDLAAKKEAERKAEEKQKQEEVAKKAAANDQIIENVTGYWLAHDMACHITKSYIACAQPNSDFIINEQLKNIQAINHSEIEITYTDGVKVNLKLTDNNTVLVTDNISYRRVSKDEANSIYDGYYELP